MIGLNKREKITLFFIGLLVFVNILVWKEVFNFFNPDLDVVFFNVGQGDSTFIETPQGHQILIDGGPGSKVIRGLKKKIPFWDKSIDLIILTHPERDHLEGLLEVLKRYKVDYILWTGIVRKTRDYKEWRKLIKEEGAQIIIAKKGGVIKAGEARINILYPFKNLKGETFDDSNETSIVSRLVFGNTSFLFTGDISKSTEEKLIQEYSTLTSDVLKVAHHGSRFSSSERFLWNVSPKIAVIPVGKNNYGHPAEEVLRGIRSITNTILRTDRDGDIEIISNGNNLLIKN